MKYSKINPEISYADFYRLASPVKHFNSLRGKNYEVQSIRNDIMTFIRKSSGEIWSMDLKGVHKAYIELTDFKTENFRSYVPLTHSPALGLLLHMELLAKR